MKYKIKFTGYVILDGNGYWEAAFDEAPPNPSVHDFAEDVRRTFGAANFILESGLEDWIQLEIEEVHTDETGPMASNGRPDGGVTVIDNDPSVSPRRKAS